MFRKVRTHKPRALSKSTWEVINTQTKSLHRQAQVALHNKLKEVLDKPINGTRKFPSIP